MTGEQDTAWLADLVMKTPAAIVLQENGLEAFSRHVPEDEEAWLAGDRVLRQYLELRRKVEDRYLGDGMLPVEERKLNALLLRAFADIEDEESLI